MDHRPSTAFTRAHGAGDGVSMMRQIVLGLFAFLPLLVAVSSETQVAEHFGHARFVYMSKGIDAVSLTTANPVILKYICETDGSIATSVQWSSSAVTGLECSISNANQPVAELTCSSPGELHCMR